MRLAEAEAVGFGFDLPKNPSEKAVVAPIAPNSKETGHVVTSCTC